MPFDLDGPVTTVAVSEVRGGHSPRQSGENLDHVRTLADTIGELPPIIVRRDDMRVVDGMHRLRAARLRGEERIAVRFFEGGDDEAFVLAVRTNVTHGLPLSLADRKAAAARIIASHSHWSDRMIATVAGLSAATVARLRRERPEPAPEVRLGNDGKLRPVNSLERRRVARAILLTEPGLSLREVARRAGISPETARSVRRKLAEADPAPAPDTATLVVRLRSDPTLRFSETGRALLRLLEARSVTPDQWAAIAANVPSHWRDTVARMAIECADAWRSFAETLLDPRSSKAG
ncbi:ParB/RepB/Spo0J family partition protein [Actinophytocola algeriensis]|uniref:ParB-like chromosome segregation protein Spo0J n=1 Tax=Actinophytocola algeriensis TaxID=1768010 RepID=A0A7W7Q5T6_9PSEU|nr:ParB N-terminal domain-containing protein [Actinophytocola algeriensis]MBB4907610.1 ParB-like chromosome segregation protein Spo0J [Actinophytocola algeriensis]MBE1479640.1 ParB-like chromosome segregation protein Spo0J [Actinophytocola algeriensis]